MKQRYLRKDKVTLSIAPTVGAFPLSAADTAQADRVTNALRYVRRCFRLVGGSLNEILLDG